LNTTQPFLEAPIKHLAGNIGGGMSNGSGNPTLSNVIFSNNSASEGGGGMYNGQGSPTLSNVTFSANTANGEGIGGGMYNEYGVSVMLSNVTFSANSGVYGGGMSNRQGNPTLSNVTFSDNSAAVDGGGMFNSNYSSVLMTNVTFSANTAETGGGMYNSYSSLTMSNVTFSANTAETGGGMSNGNSNPTLFNVTFSANTANLGGGIFNSSYNFNGSLTLTNSILWGNSPDQIYNSLEDESVVTNSDVEGGYEGIGNIDANPLLATLGNYGGEVETMAILPGSPVIDFTSSNCPTTDARGVIRSSPSCDLGAFESRGFSLVKAGGDNQSTAIDTMFAQPLCVVVTANGANEPVDGGKITFTPPASGTSATMLTNPATIVSGSACTHAHANGIAGSYTVNASGAGAGVVTFNLNNNPNVKLYLTLIIK
jgi:hypothetical protein